MSDSAKRYVYPFSAIVGQDYLKLALILNTIDPKIGGVMLMGDRGTGKSTAVRALADLLPKISIVAGDPYNSDPKNPSTMSDEAREKWSLLSKGESLETAEKKSPMVDLPLGATEDRVCGTIDLEKALAKGVRAFEPGLLASANRGFLYVDEINLLDDHLVDILLDSCASGWNTVEREGVSIRHPADFVLIGSGNPEEGQLRPQLLDRFGHFQDIRTETNFEDRMLIVRRRLSFDQNPEKFCDEFEPLELKLQAKIIRARNLLESITIDDILSECIVKYCAEEKLDGLRGDMVIMRTAMALAAYEANTEGDGGLPKVFPRHVIEATHLSVPHRLKKDIANLSPAEEILDDSVGRLAISLQEALNIDNMFDPRMSYWSYPNIEPIRLGDLRDQVSGGGL